MRLCWADKIPLALFVLITLTLLALGGSAPDNSQYCQSLRLEHPTWTQSYCFVTSAQHWSAFAGIEWIILYKIIAPIWIALRLFDLMGNGPALRREGRDRRGESNARRETMAGGGIDLPRSAWTSSTQGSARQRRWPG